MKSVCFCIFFPLILFFLSFTSNAKAGQVTLMWDPPAISTDVAGYVVDYGIASGSYSFGINVGNTTSYTVGNLSDGQTYYFAVAAYNSTGTDSGYSNEVSRTMEVPKMPLSILKAGTGMGVVSGGGINCGSSCSAMYPSSSVVSLTAAANTGSIFAGWSGGECSGTGLCATTINAATTVTATFNTSIYVITASVNGTGGVISPSGALSVSSGGSKTFTITPNTGYRIAYVMVDGKSAGAVANHTFSNVTANHAIVASFMPNIVTYTITAAVNGKGGVISPSGDASISNAGTKTFIITPKTGYRTAGVTVNGKSVGAVTKYTFNNVTANQTITATFKRR